MLMFLGATTPGADALASALAADVTLAAPAAPDDAGWGWDWDVPLDAWRQEIAGGPAADGVVVCTWPTSTAPMMFADLDPEAWRVAVEWPTALWFTTLVAAAERCADGGSVVVVAERPTTLDAIGHAPLVAVSEGLVNLVRSLAAVHGKRDVRVNAVLTAVHTAPEVLLGAPPPLASHPGRVDIEVAGAVRLLLSSDAVGLTGTTITPDGGR